MFLLGETVGKYKILANLGSGGFGTVFLALDTMIDKKVAIKVPHRQSGEMDDLRTEPRLLAALNHPNIVTIHTADKIDGPGLVKVATFVKEGIVYLGEREQPLTNTIASMKGAPAAASAGTPPAATPAPAGGGQGRRVSFGTMPDFAFAGPGVKVAGVTPGSPAEKAGVKEGDVLLKIDGKDVASLQGFSGLLRELTPGQTVKVVLLRGGQEQTLDVTVVER